MKEKFRMRSKRVLSFLLTLTMLAGMLPAISVNAGAVDYDNGTFTYTISSGNATIKGFLPDVGSITTDLVIPSKIDGYPVTGVTSSAFKKNTIIRTLSFENGGTYTIGSNAFSECTSLETVDLTGVVSLGASFTGCKNLTSVMTGEELTTVTTAPFNNTGISELNIPASLTDFGSISLLLACSTLETVTVNGIHPTVVVKENVVYSKSEDTLVCYPAAKSGTSYSSPSSVTTVLTAFMYNQYLETVTLRNVENVSTMTFYSCESLKDVEVLGKITSLPILFISHCYVIETLTIPDSVTEINYWFVSPNIWSDNIGALSAGGFKHLRLLTPSFDFGTNEVLTKPDYGEYESYVITEDGTGSTETVLGKAAMWTNESCTTADIQIDYGEPLDDVALDVVFLVDNSTWMSQASDTVSIEDENYTYPHLVLATDLVASCTEELLEQNANGKDIRVAALGFGGYSEGFSGGGSNYISWSTDSIGDSGFSTSASDVTRKMLYMDFANRDYAKGLLKAKEMIDNREDKSRQVVVVLISNGEPVITGEDYRVTLQRAQTAAQNLKDIGVSIYPIGIFTGSAVWSSGAEDALKSISYDGNTVYTANNSGDFEAKIEELLESAVTQMNTVVVDDLSKYFKVDATKKIEVTAGSVSIDGDKILWNLLGAPKGEVYSMIIHAELDEVYNGTYEDTNDSLITKEYTADSSGTITLETVLKADDQPELYRDVQVSPEGTITKIASLEQVNQGNEFIYTIMATNASTATADWENVEITDDLPSGITYGGLYAISDGGTCSTVMDATTVTASFGNIPAGESRSVSFYVRTSNASVGSITNEAKATSDNQDPVKDTADVEILSGGTNTPDTSISKTADDTEYMVGDTVTYSIKVTNEDNTEAWNNITITDQLPTGLTYVNAVWDSTATSSGTTNDNDISENNGVITAKLATLTPGQYATLTVTATVNKQAGDTIENKVAVTSQNAPKDEDSVEVDVIYPDVSLTKKADKTAYTSGETITFTLKATNDSNSTIDWKNVVLTDALPSGLTYVDNSITTTSGTASVTGNVIRVECGTLEPGDTVTVTLEATSSKTGEFTNKVEAKSDNYKTIEDQEKINVTEIPTPEDTPNGTVTKTASVKSVEQGGSFYYTITVKNSGTGAWNTVVASDVLPNGITYAGLRSVSDGVECNNVAGDTDISINFGDVVAGATKSVSFYVNVSDTATTGEVENTAKAKGDGQEEVEDSSTVVINTSNGTPSPSIEKTVSKTSIVQGNNVVYTIKVSNDSDATADWKNIAVSDVIPDGFEYVSDTSSTGATSTVDGQEITIDFGTLEAGQSKSIAITIKVTTSASTGETTNTAVANSNNYKAIEDSAKITVKSGTTTGGGGGGGSTTYTVTYDSNGGSGSYSDSGLASGATYTVKTQSATSITRSGYTFKGWNTKADGTGTAYASGDTFNISGNVTLYAQWEASLLNMDDHVAYIIGYPDGTVRPANEISRAEVSTIFFRLLTDSARSSNWSTGNSYSDVSSDNWYNNAVSTMSKASIVNGYTNGTFSGNRSITRAEFAAIAARFDSSTYSGGDKFSDISGHWAAEYINRAAEKGWITGYTDGSFKPDQYITRAEAMTLVNRVLGRDLINDMHADMITWSDNLSTAWYYEAVQEATNSHDYDRDSSGYESWTKVTAAPDWAALEKSWSNANSVAI